METMWHLWLRDGGFKKELHACRECAERLGLDAPETLVVVAAVNDAFQHNVEELRERTPAFVRMDTSMGGHPSAAFIKAYHQFPDYPSYLFLQDTLTPTVWNYVRQFAEVGAPVVGWARFPLPMYDGEGQRQWVADQYPGVEEPSHGIFGPIFYATRKAMEATELWFPRTPKNRLEAQGTERAWAWAFKAAGVEVEFLHDWNNGFLASGRALPFQKYFAGRA